MPQESTKNLPPDRLWQPVTAKWFFAIFGAALSYAILRYHIAGDVPWAHFPLMAPAIATMPMMAKAIGGVRWKRSQRLG